jgi:hypothetical protein
VIKVYLDAEQLPIQAGGQSQRTTAWLLSQNLKPGTYNIQFHARRSDNSEVMVPISLVVESPIEGSWPPFPEIIPTQLPPGYVGVQYPLDMVTATLTTGDTSTNNQLNYTSNVLGKTGNSISLTYAAPMTVGSKPSVIPNSPLRIIVHNMDITVYLATDYNSTLVTTASDIKGAIRNNETANGLVNIVGVGTTTGRVPPMDKTFFTGGTDPTPSFSVAPSPPISSGIGTCGDIANAGGGGGSSSPPTVNPAASPPPPLSYIWSITPGLYGTNGLPPGLNFDAALAAIYGIPTKEGDYVVTVHVLDSNNYRATTQVPITIFPGRPEPAVRLGEYWMLPREIYDENEPELEGILTEPIPDNPIQDLVPFSRYKKNVLESSSFVEYAGEWRSDL